jgi:hypothetical protein
MLGQIRFLWPVVFYRNEKLKNDASRDTLLGARYSVRITGGGESLAKQTELSHFIFYFLHVPTIFFYRDAS